MATDAEIRALVTEARNRVTEYGSLMRAEMSTASLKLQEIFSEAVPGAGTVFTDPREPGEFVPAVPPTLQQSTITLPTAPGAAPGLQAVPNVWDGIGNLPKDDLVAPTYNAPDRPTAIRAFTDVPPDINIDAEFPDAPAALDAVVLVPALSTYTMPDKPEVSIATFDGIKPMSAAVAPTNLKGDFDAEYRDRASIVYQTVEGQFDAFMHKINPLFAQQMSALEAKLAAMMAGGTGLAPAVEAAIWERARDRNTGEAQRVERATYAEDARRGFTIPSGAARAALQQARQAAADNNVRASIEIGIKQAELEQQNTQFAVTTSLSLRQVVLQVGMQYHGTLVQINAQALDSAKAVASLLVQVYNSTVDAYKAALDGYRADAAVFETRMKGAQLLIDLYRAELAAEEAKVSVDQGKVTLYKSQIEAQQTMAATYRTRVEAVVSKAQLEKLRIELFGTRVQAYAAEVSAKNSENQAYSAAVNGEQARIGVYTEQMKAKAIEADVFKTRLSVRSEEIRAASVTNQGRISAYEAQVRAYGEVVRAEGIRVGAEADMNRALIQAYEVASRAAEAKARSDAQFYEAVSQVAIARERSETTRQTEYAKVHLSAADSIARVATSAGDAYARITAASAGSVNSLVGAVSTN